MPGYGLAYGAGAASDSLQQILARRYAQRLQQEQAAERQQQQLIENKMRQQGLDQTGENQRLSREFQQAQLANLKANQEGIAEDRANVQGTAEADQIPAGTRFSGPQTPTMGRLQTLGLLRPEGITGQDAPEGIRAPNQPPMQEMPGTVGSAPSPAGMGYLKMASQKQAEAAADDARQDAAAEETARFHRETAGKETGGAPQVFFDDKGKPHAYQFKNGVATEIPLPGNIVGKTAPKPDLAQEYAEERITRVVASVDALKKKVSPFTTGWGSKLQVFPATASKNFAAELKTLAANIAFSELVAMRQASKTGGALGQVSDREGILLQSALGSLDQEQSPDNVLEQLEKIKGSLLRWQAAARQAATDGGATPPDAGIEEWIRGPDGKLRKK